MNLPFPPFAIGAPRAVETRRAFAWYEEAMRLFKLAPVTWCALGLITLGADLGLQLLPGVGMSASKILVPLVECGMLIGAAALDRSQPLSLRYAYAALSARPAAIAAIVASALVVFAAQALTIYFVSGANLLTADSAIDDLSTAAIFGSIAIGALASLPVAFVPFAVLFSETSFADAFTSSMRGFALNVAPLLIFAALAVLLVVLGLLLMGIGLIAVYPLLSAATYAAWKDIYAVSKESA